MRLGVTVEVLVPGDHLDSKLVRRASRHRWGKLLQNGVRIFEYLPTMFHRKVMAIDDPWVSVGSAIFDNRSFRLNDEANMNVFDCEFAPEKIAAFAKDELLAREITWEKWKRRPSLESGYTPWPGIAARSRIWVRKELHAPQPPTNKINTVSTDIHSEPTMNQLPEAAREIARRAADTARETAQRATFAFKDVTGAVEDAVGDVTNATKDAAMRATDAAMDIYQSAALKAGDTLATSKEYVRRNPVPVVLGAIAFGAAIGYMLMMARRKPSFSERYAGEPLVAVREALLGALAPVAHRVHQGYDSARDGAEKAIDRVHSFSPGRAADSFSDQIGRIGNNLKFW